MKKIIVFALLFAIALSACSSKQENEKKLTISSKKPVCNKFYTILTGKNSTYTFQAKVVSSNVKNILSPSAGIVSYLDCTPGKKVKPKTLIAKIIPDISDTNTKSLINQKKYILDQIKNTQTIINSTKLNFAQQLNSLNLQKQNLEKQIKILQANLVSLEKQKNYGLNDLNQQLNTLKDQLKNLEISEKKLEKTKNDEIAKLEVSIGNTRQAAKSLIKNVLWDIDELFGITDQNKYKNDSFETYLAAKNTSLKEKIKNTFVSLNSLFLKSDNFSNKDFSNYMQKVDNLVNDVKKAINSSITSLTFPKTQIDNLYLKFNNYDNNLIQIKGNLDNLIKSLDSVKNTYDNQIISVKTNITSVKNNIKNLKENKLNSYIENIQLQINQVKSQLQTNETSLKNILTNIENLKNQENIQINQLQNQLIQMKNNLSNLNVKLSPNRIYAQVSGKVKLKNTSKGNKIGLNSLICQILPNKTSLKLQVFLPDNVNIVGKYVDFYTDKGICKIKVISKLPYKDLLTQNIIYETENFALCNGKKIDLSKLFQEGEVISVKYKKSLNSLKIKIPLEFVINEINGEYVYKVSGTGSYIKSKIKLGNIDGSNVEVLSGLNLLDKICR